MTATATPTLNPAKLKLSVEELKAQHGAPPWNERIVMNDRYVITVIFQNPGHDNHWITVKLVGKKTNRAAIGARIKVSVPGDAPNTFYRHVTSGSSFGANTLQQTIGIGKAQKISTLEVHWPTSKTTQVFSSVLVDQAIEITEFEPAYRQHGNIVRWRGRA